MSTSKNAEGQSAVMNGGSGAGGAGNEAGGTGSPGGARAGHGMAGETPVFLISKISMSPSRKFNLGNYNTAELSAGIEIVFPEPVAPGSEALQKGFDFARKTVVEEMKLQYKPYAELIKKAQEKGGR